MSASAEAVPPARKATARERSGCCKAWDEVPAESRGEWRWQVLHQLSHSRVAFSVEHLARTARINLTDAQHLIGEAKARKWAWASEADGLWVGRLPSGRR